MDTKYNFCTNVVIPKELLTENLGYLGIVCNLLLKHLSKLNQWSIKEEVTGLKTIYSRWIVSQSYVLKKQKNIQQRPDTGPER